MTIKPRTIPCPHCRKATVYSLDNAFRPFCSERCKNEDIIAWADGRYRLATPVSDEDEDENQTEPSETNSDDTP